MEQTPHGPHSRGEFGNETTQRRKPADYVYQAATVAAALLLLLTATV
jgi:hypothetical protein